MKVITFSEAVVYGKRKGTKTGKIRRFPVNKQLLEVLLEVQMKFPATPESLVFPSPTGITIDSHNFLNRAWTTVLKGLPIHYRKQYCTRHTFITLCLESGVKVKQVAEWVGNSPHMIWQHYAGLVSECDVPEL
jgi:integrase